MDYKNVYIDIGCYDGDTVRQFRNWRHLMTSDDWQIYAFDPNPRFKLQWRKQSLPWIHFEQSAAWIADTELDFTLRPKSAPYGSTVMKEKRDWGKGKVMKVKA